MAKKPKAVKTGNTEESDGATICEYNDGTWRYLGDGGKTKGALARKPEWLVPFDEETALVAHDIKRTLKQEDAEVGLIRAMEGMSPRKIRTGHEGMQFVYERQAELAASPDAPGSTAAAKFVEGAFYGGTHKEVPTINIKIDNATLHAIQQVEERHVDGEFKEVEMMNDKNIEDLTELALEPDRAGSMDAAKQLAELLAGITPENRHGEISTGAAVGEEFVEQD